MELDKKRIEEFVRRTLKDYKESNCIGDFVFKSEINENQTDGTFTKIGVRPLVKRELFLPPKGSIFIVPELFGLGHSIALGEENHFIGKLLEDSRIERIRIDKSNFTPDILSENLDMVKGDTSIFFNAINEGDLLKDQNWEGHLSYKQDMAYFNSYYPVHVVGGKLIRDTVIIFDKLSSMWVKVLFDNKHANTKIPLKIEIGTGRNDEKVDILIYSLVKFNIYEPNKIKILKLD